MEDLAKTQRIKDREMIDRMSSNVSLLKSIIAKANQPVAKEAQDRKKNDLFLKEEFSFIRGRGLDKCLYAASKKDSSITLCFDDNVWDVSGVRADDLSKDTHNYKQITYGEAKKIFKNNLPADFVASVKSK